MPKESRKQLIAQTALQLFAEKGYENTSTQLIAKEANVSEALIFKHFGNKEQLLAYVIDSGYKRIIERNRGRLQEEDPLTLVHRVIELPYMFVKEEPQFWKLQSRLFNVEVSRKHHERFMQPMPGLLRQAFKRLGYADPDHETELLLLIVEALWKIEGNKDDEQLQKMLTFIKTKYKVQE